MGWGQKRASGHGLALAPRDPYDAAPGPQQPCQLRAEHTGWTPREAPSHPLRGPTCRLGHSIWGSGREAAHAPTPPLASDGHRPGLAPGCLGRGTDPLEGGDRGGQCPPARARARGRWDGLLRRDSGSCVAGREPGEPRGQRSPWTLRTEWPVRKRAWGGGHLCPAVTRL